MTTTEKIAINYLQMRGYVVITKETEDLYHSMISKSKKVYQEACDEHKQAIELYEEASKLVNRIKSDETRLE